MKPRIFIGSSSESLPIAYAIQEELDNDALITVWKQGVFTLSSNTLDDLISTLDISDFAVFVFSPEDIVSIRNQKLKTTRDNVVFELGLFVGRLGKKRSFIIRSQGQSDFHLPTDLLGTNVATFNSKRPDGNLRAALGPACNQIRISIDKWVSSKFGDLLTPSLVYLLRHMALIDDYRPQNSYSGVLAAYTNDLHPLDFFPRQKTGWEKAALYACLYLRTHGLVKMQPGSARQVNITELGKFILTHKTIKREFKAAFKKPMIYGGEEHGDFKDYE
jgi:hypothetical protein